MNTQVHVFLYAEYRSLGYMGVVHEAAEISMNLAVNKVKERPDYAQSGEVYSYIVPYTTCSYMYLCIYLYMYIKSAINVGTGILCSGSSLMLDMTQLPMHITQLCHVYQEGDYTHTCTCMQTHM